MVTIGTGGAGEVLSLESLPLRSRHHFEVAVDPETDGVAVHVLVGGRRRPCLALVAGVHGNEYEGMVTLVELLREAGTWPLEGSLIVVPVANPFAFRAAQRRTPQDDCDLNRVFPGAATGSLSERLAHRLCAGVLASADLVFTLHSAMADGVLAPWVEFLDGPSALERATYEAAVASGFPDLVALPRLPGVLQTALAERGVPVIEGEVGGLGATTPENVVYYLARVAAVARHAGVLSPGLDPHGAARAAPRVWRLRGVEAEVRGIFRPAVELRQGVGAGDLLGTILDVREGSRRDVRSPVAAVVGGHRVHAGVRSGDRLVTLWSPVDTVRGTTA
jgi:N-alpha-acetyl-L-2,4-diaminobutyrate deacetylase